MDSEADTYNGRIGVLIPDDRLYCGACTQYSHREVVRHIAHHGVMRLLRGDPAIASAGCTVPEVKHSAYLFCRVAVCFDIHDLCSGIENHHHSEVPVAGVR